MVNDPKQALRQLPQDDSYEKEHFMRDRYGCDSNPAIKTESRNKGDFGTNFDMVYDMVTSYTPTFSEVVEPERTLWTNYYPSL